MTEPEHVHGRWRTYNQRKCRCDKCTEAWRVYVAKLKLDRMALIAAGTEPKVIHGTVSGYVNWNCRCEGCTIAVSQYRKQRKAASDAE